MRTVELMEQLLAVADRLGYRVRHEWLGGTGGGACEFAGRKWIFVDLALNTYEQLEQVASALKADPAVHLLELSSAVARQLDLRRAA
jgi:hypothetical protein